MSPKRRGTRILGLILLAALGLMVVTAGVAQAENGEFRVEDETFNQANVNSKVVLGSIEEGELLVPGIGLEIECASGGFLGTVLKGGVAHVTVLVSGCDVLLEQFCDTYETEHDMNLDIKRNTLLASGLGLLILHSEEHYIVFEGDPLATIWVSPEPCTLPLGEPLAGVVAFKLPNALAEVTLQIVENTMNLHALGLLLNHQLLLRGYAHLGLRYGDSGDAHIHEGSAEAHLATLENWGTE